MDSRLPRPVRLVIVGIVVVVMTVVFVIMVIPLHLLGSVIIGAYQGLKSAFIDISDIVNEVRRG